MSKYKQRPMDFAGLTRDNLALAIEIASLPETIRGYGHIKARSAAAAPTAAPL